jgi:hypothetical protein
MTLPSVIVLELGDGIELPEALAILGQHFPRKTGTVVHAAIRDRAEAILAFAKGEASSWPPPKFPGQARAGTWPPPLQHK